MTEDEVVRFLASQPTDIVKSLATATHPGLVCWEFGKTRLRVTWDTTCEPFAVVEYDGASEEVVRFSIGQGEAGEVAAAARKVLGGARRAVGGGIAFVPSRGDDGWFAAVVYFEHAGNLQGYTVRLEITREELVAFVAALTASTGGGKV